MKHNQISEIKRDDNPSHAQKNEHNSSTDPGNNKNQVHQEGGQRQSVGTDPENRDPADRPVSETGGTDETMGNP